MKLDVVLGRIDAGMLLPPLLLFEEAAVTRIVEAAVYRCMLEGSTFVLTLFESCEPCSGFVLRAQRRTVVHNDDEFRSQIFRDHDLSKSMRSIVGTQ